ncbi:MAG TPA: alpha/beta hydrolase-fold protein [Candidatus Eremiobacteraceae bacterium]
MSDHGRIEILKHSSDVLKGNALHDPHQRDTCCYLPPGYDAGSARYPVIFFLPGFTGTGRMLLNFDPFAESMDRRLDRLIGSGLMLPAIVVMPDCFTRYGGSQYLNSPAVGRYEDYVVDELVPLVDDRLRTMKGRAHRAVSGKSSGGYGAMRLAMRHPDVFGAFGSHSGDCYFEHCFKPDFPKFFMQLEKYGGVTEFLRAFDAMPKKLHDATMTLMMLAMAACYSPNAESPYGFDLPMDEKTGEIRADVWERWIAEDPVQMAPLHASALRSMKAIFLDAGLKDEWNLHLGARIMCSRFDALGVRYIHEEYDDGHMGVVYRYDRSLIVLAKAMA